MAKKSHSKYQNTGVLFELLIRQITSDILSGGVGKATKIINEFFKVDSELNKELHLYHALMNQKYDDKSKAEELIKTAVDIRKNLNEELLKKQRYNLIKRIKDSYDMESFLKSKIKNYKELASICNLFEQVVNNLSPVEIVNSKYTLVEHITSNKSAIEEKKSALIEKYETMDKDDRLLSYKFLLDSFNKKYGSLNIKQKNLLREYINNVSDSVRLRNYIESEIPTIRKEIVELAKGIPDKVVKIKLKEIINQLKVIKESKGDVKDAYVIAIMKYYELADELRKVTV